MLDRVCILVLFCYWLVYDAFRIYTNLGLHISHIFGINVNVNSPVTLHVRYQEKTMVTCTDSGHKVVV